MKKSISCAHVTSSVDQFAAKWGISWRTARRMLMRQPQLTEVSDEVVRIFINMSRVYAERQAKGKAK